MKRDTAEIKYIAYSRKSTEGEDRQILSLVHHGLLGFRVGHGHGVGALQIGYPRPLEHTR